MPLPKRLRSNFQSCTKRPHQGPFVFLAVPTECLGALAGRQADIPQLMVAHLRQIAHLLPSLATAPKPAPCIPKKS